MGDMMAFPASVEEFMEQYKMTDTEHVYSNGTEYVPIYRMKQWFEHCRNQQFPVADVATVRHGRWEKQSGLYSCSECGMTCPYDVQADVIEYWACNYCPNCGAKMDLEEAQNGK